MLSFRSLSLLLPLISLPSSYAFPSKSSPAKAVKQISERSTYHGGWPLGLVGIGSPPCPASAPSACTVPNDVNPACCPADQFCFVNSVTTYCCPTNEDCSHYMIGVTYNPVCADPTWNLYSSPFGGFFCCPPDQQAVNDFTVFGGMCYPLSEVVSTQSLATEIAPASAIVLPATVNGAAASTTSFITMPPTPPAAITTLPGGITVPITQTLPTATAAAGSSGSGNNDTSDDLSLAAKIGIGVGLAVVTVIIILCVKYWPRKETPAVINEYEVCSGRLQPVYCPRHGVNHYDDWQKSSYIDSAGGGG